MNIQNLLLKDKNIIVVGGAGLLGSAICRAVLSSGASCIIADISEDKGMKLAAQLQIEFNKSVSFIKVSITDKESVDTMIKESVAIFGKIDGLVNAAYPKSSNYGKRFEDEEYEDFCENVNLHLGGYFLVSQRILEYFKKNGGGVLLNISSIYGVVAPRFEIYNGTTMINPVDYAAIKSAIVHMTKYMAKYYSNHNIKVNTLSLGGLLDKQPEAFLNSYRKYCLNKGMLDPSDITGSVVYLLSDESRFVNGHNLVVDDGFTL